jgi:hypothetical protein
MAAAGWLARRVNDRHPAAPAARAGALTGLLVVPGAIAAGQAGSRSLAPAATGHPVVLPDPPQERPRLAEPGLEFRAFCTPRRLPASSTRQLERAWRAERCQRGEISRQPGYTDNPFRPR